MDTLPPELLFEIFQHLSVVDLVHLSKVSAHFRAVIESTPKLKFFSLTFDKRGRTACEKTKRYAELTVHHYTPRIHQHILQLCGANITSVRFVDSSATFTQIAHILRLTPTVSQVRFENCSTWPEVVRQLPELRNNLYIQLIESSLCILDLFLRSQVHALLVVNQREQNGTGIRSFLGSQAHLKSLSCKGRKVLDTFYAMGNSFDENYRRLPFQLKNLVLTDIAWNPIYTDLLLPSVNSLAYVELTNIFPIYPDVELFLSMCRNLEILKLNDCHFAGIAPSNLRRLSLRGRVGSAAFVTRLKKLRHLKVAENSSVQFDLRENEELESVEVSGCDVVSAFLMPHVRKLKLAALNQLPETIFGETLRRVEEVEVVDCGENTERILRELAGVGRNLATLRVDGGSICRDTLGFLRQQLGNLKELATLRLTFVESEAPRE